jgi:hypothetical protein
MANRPDKFGTDAGDGISMGNVLNGVVLDAEFCVDKKN